MELPAASWVQALAGRRAGGYGRCEGLACELQRQWRRGERNGAWRLRTAVPQPCFACWRGGSALARSGGPDGTETEGGRGHGTPCQQTPATNAARSVLFSYSSARPSVPHLPPPSLLVPPTPKPPPAPQPPNPAPSHLALPAACPAELQAFLSQSESGASLPATTALVGCAKLGVVPPPAFLDACMREAARDSRARVREVLTMAWSLATLRVRGGREGGRGLF